MGAKSHLQMMLEEHHQLYAYCANAFKCHHSASLRIDCLIQRLGWDFDIYAHHDEFVYRLICSKCGTRKPDMIYLPYAKAQSTPIRSHSELDTLPTQEVIERHYEFKKAMPVDPHKDERRKAGKGKARTFGKR